MTNNQFQFQQGLYDPNRVTTPTGVQNNFVQPRQQVSANQYTALPGRVVFSADQITPQEIPSNGAPALFPLSDGQTIIVKALQADGTFSHDIYVKQQPGPYAQNADINNIFSRLDAIEQRLNRNTYRKNNYHKTQNKEVKK